MAYEQRARTSPSQPDNFLDPTKKNLNPWQDKSANNYLSGYHGNVVYHQQPVSPQLDPMLQETDDGWSEWPDDWDVEDSDQCMSNGFSNGFNTQSPYLQQQQQHQITSQHQPQVPTPNQQQVPQPKVESAPPNLFFDNFQLNNSTHSTSGSTAHLFSQDSMAATLRTGVSYAAALSGNAETPEQNNGGFDDINLNDNTDTGFSEEKPFTQLEPELPAASFSPFPTPAQDKMERSASHLFSVPATAFSGASPNNLFGSAAEASLENDDDFGDERTCFDQEQQQKGNISHADVQESFDVSQPHAIEEKRPPQVASKEAEEPITNAFEVHRPPPNDIGHPNIEDAFASSEPFTFPTPNQKQPGVPSTESEETMDNTFEVHRTPSNDIGHPNIEDAFASSEPFTFPTPNQKQPGVPSTESEETMDNAFDVHRASSNDVVPPNIKDSTASIQPFTYPTHKKLQPELPLQPAEEATGDVIEESEPSNESVSQGIEYSFASDTPFIYPSQQKQPELLVQGAEMTDVSNFGVHSAPSEEGFSADVEDSFTSHQTLSFANQVQRKPEMGTQESEEAGSIHVQEDLHPERSQNCFFAPEAPSQNVDIDEVILDQTVERPNQVVPDMEVPFAAKQPAFAVEDQQPPENHSQYPEYEENFQDHFRVEWSSYDENNEPTESVNKMAWKHGESMSGPGELFQDGQQDHMALLDTAPWQHTAQEVSLSYPSEMVTGKEPNISMPEVSPDISESDSSASSHDTSSNSDQSQIETAAWREEEVTSYDAYSQLPPTSLVPQPTTRDQRENDVPSGEFYEPQQSTTTPIIAGKDGPREIVDEHLQPTPPPGNIRQPSKVEGIIPENDFFQHENHSPPTAAEPPHPLSVGKREADVPKASGQKFFQPDPAPISMVQTPPISKIQEDVSMSNSQEFFQPDPAPISMVQTPPISKIQEDVSKPGPAQKSSSQTVIHPGPPPANMAPPPPSVGKKENVIPSISAQTYFTPGPPPTNMIQQPPGGVKEVDVPETGVQGYFQPGSPATNMVQPPPITGSKMKENTPNTGTHDYFQPGPPATNMVQPPPITGSKMKENAPNTGTHDYFQPGPPATNMVQPPPITGSKMKENTPNTGTHDYFQPGPPATNMVQPPPITGSKMKENAPNTGTHDYFQPGPPATNMVQPPPITGSKTQENAPNTGTHNYFQSGPPATNIVQPPPITGNKTQQNTPNTGTHDYFQPGPPATNIVQPPPITGNKTQQNTPNTGTHNYFQPATKPTQMVQPPPMTASTTQENTPNTGTQYFQPGPSPTNMMQPPPVTGIKTQKNTPNTGTYEYFQPGSPNIVQPSHEATDKAEDVLKTGGHRYYQSGPPPSSTGQPHSTMAVKTDTSISPSRFSVQEQSVAPTDTMQSPSMDFGKRKDYNQPPPSMVPLFAAESLKKPDHEHSQPAPATSSAPAAGQMEHNARPAKTSTPEPQMPPESGPMAMTKRPIRGEKARTPVSLSSSLWSTDVPTAMAPAIMLAPALQPSPKPAAPIPAAPEQKQDSNNPQSWPSEQDIKADSLASLSKKERKAEKKRLKALKKEQTKLEQESKTVEDPLPPKQVLTLLHDYPTNPSADSSLHHTSKDVMQESGHLESEREYVHDKHRRGGEFGAQHKEMGNPHVGDYETNEKLLIRHPRESEYHGKYVGSDGHGIGVPHRGEHRSHYDEEHVEDKRHPRHRNVDDESYSKPRVRELREESPSRLSRQQDYTHRHDDHDSYHDHYSGLHGLRRSHEDLNDRSFRGRRHYDDSRHNISREYDEHHSSRYSSDQDDNRYERDYRYTRDRRDADEYRNYDRDHYERGQTRADNYDYYSSRRSRDEHYLDHSFDSQYDRGRPERSSREELESYRGEYYRDSADRGIFKPINDPHYGDYKDSYRSTTPSSSSGRSTPAGYDYMHNPYYGYQHPQHPYPGYDPHYGYYPGPYGMPYHYPPPPGYYPGYGPYYDYYHQYGGFSSAQGSQYSSGEGSYPDNQGQEGPQARESALERDQEEDEVQEATPLRTTPLHFLRPHTTCRFGPAGQLLVTLPHHPADGQKPLVQVSTLKAIFSIEEQEQIKAFPGPLSCHGTVKKQVIEYIQGKADEIQQSSTDQASQLARWVLWKFLLSMIKHYGAIVAEDIAEILMMSVQHFEKRKKKKIKMKRKRHQSEESNSSDSSSDDDDSSEDNSSDSSDDEASSEEDDASKPPDHLLVFRGLLLEGKTKEALEYAMINSLWAHAVLLGGLMDTKVNDSLLDSKNSSSIISRFFMTLEEKDPLKTVYEHLGGKVPHAVKHPTNWPSNLAGIIANPTSFPEKDKENIITLGDTLAKHPDLVMASHLCYLLAGLRPGSPGMNCKMVLIGCEHRSKKCDKFESLEALQLTELFEYASSLENPEFFLPSLQMFRYFYATKLIDAGYHKEALAYLRCIGDLMIKYPHSFNKTMKNNVYRTTEQLVGYMEQAGTSVELFVLTWLKKFNNVLEGRDSEISLPQQESEIEDDEDPMAQSSMSYFSGYDYPPAQEEQSSPESTPYTHNTVSRQASLQSTHSVPSVHSLQTLDLSQPVPTEIYQPNEPVKHKDSVSSLGYQDQTDGQEYSMRQPMESVDPWQQQQQQQQFGNDMWMPGVAQQNNSWMPPTSVEETGRGTSPEDGETTPVNASQTFDDFYLQANPMRTGIGANWGDESGKTPTISPSESSLPSKEATEFRDKEEKADNKATDKNKQAQSSGFWNGITGLVKTLIPKGPKEVHLPDDKNKTIYFDKELNKWVNTDESEEDRAPPPPPPTDAMIGGMSGPPFQGPRPAGNPGIPGNPMAGASRGVMPPNPTMPVPGTMNTQAEVVPDNSRGGTGAPAAPGSTGNNQQSLPGMQTKPAGPPSKFSRKAQGRLGSRNKYVDVLNPNKGSQTSSQTVPSALFPVMPTGGSTFQGTLFVPSAAPQNDADNSSSQPPTDIQSGQENPQPPSPTHSRSSSLGSQSTASLASAEVRSYFEGQEGEQLQKAPPQQPTFFDPSTFQPQPQSHSMARRGRGRYPGGYNK